MSEMSDIQFISIFFCADPAKISIPSIFRPPMFLLASVECSHAPRRPSLAILAVLAVLAVPSAAMCVLCLTSCNNAGAECGERERKTERFQVRISSCSNTSEFEPITLEAQGSPPPAQYESHLIRVQARYRGYLPHHLDSSSSFFFFLH